MHTLNLFFPLSSSTLLAESASFLSVEDSTNLGSFFLRRHITLRQHSRLNANLNMFRRTDVPETGEVGHQRQPNICAAERDEEDEEPGRLSAVR